MRTALPLVAGIVFSLLAGFGAMFVVLLVMQQKAAPLAALPFSMLCLSRRPLAFRFRATGKGIRRPLAAYNVVAAKSAN